MAVTQVQNKNHLFDFYLGLLDMSLTVENGFYLLKTVSLYNACSSFKACFFPAGTPAGETHLLYILLYFLYVVVFIVFLLFASSNVSLSFCIPILLGMIKGLMFSSSRGVSVSSRALSFRFVFLVSLVRGLLGGCSSACLAEPSGCLAEPRGN